MSKEISKMTFQEKNLEFEESKLDPLAKSGYGNAIPEGRLSSSPLLPPPATHTKKT